MAALGLLEHWAGGAVLVWVVPSRPVLVSILL